MRVHRIATLLVFIVCFAAATSPWAARPRLVAQTRADVSEDFSALATMKPSQCAEGPKSGELSDLPPEWRLTSSQCAWQNRLQIRRWQAAPDPGKTCVSAAARWWAWARKRVMPRSPNVPWDTTWSLQSVIGGNGTQQSVAVIEHTADGTWVITEWRWLPSPREATRDWQQGRWNLLNAAVAARQKTSKPTFLSDDVRQVQASWEKTLDKSAAEIAPDGWRWERDGMCLRMETAGLSQAQLHLPYAREDGRLEQRAAIQLRLARTFPKAVWLTPFRLLPAARDAEGGAVRGAKYEAIWREDSLVKAQLWMPTRTTGSIVRLRLGRLLPVAAAHDDDVVVRQTADLLDRELIALARQWEADHEP
jgi:hypothetical protein